MCGPPCCQEPGQPAGLLALTSQRCQVPGLACWPAAARPDPRPAAAPSPGLRDALVLDIGGTTTDVGALVAGLLRPAAKTVTLAGVRTNFRLPDLLSLGLGGGSIVSWEDSHPAATAVAGSSASQAADGRSSLAAGAAEQRGQLAEVCDAPPCSVGPHSVGASLECCLVLGGDTCTAADVAVLLGKAAGLGDMAAVRPGLLPSGRQLEAAWQLMQVRLAEAVDHMKVRGPAAVACMHAARGTCGCHLRSACRSGAPVTLGATGHWSPVTIQ
jgi:hypothetical protein